MRAPLWWMTLGACGACFAVALAVLGAERATPVDEVVRLRAENEALRQMVKRLAKENDELKGQLQSLKQAMDKAGIDWSALSAPKPAPDQSEAGVPQPGQDPNTAVAEAVQKYAAVVAAIDRAGSTDIQQRERWLAAAKQLDAVLRRNCVTIAYTLDDVRVYVGEKGGSDTALLDVASATIKSSDPSVGDLAFDSIYRIRIQATATEATRITKRSSVTMRGWLALNVDLSRPASEQPSLWREKVSGTPNMPGYRPVGTVRGMPSLAYETLTIVVKEGCVVEVDGAARKMPEAGYSGARSPARNQGRGR